MAAPVTSLEKLHDYEYFGVEYDLGSIQIDAVRKLADLCTEGMITSISIKKYGNPGIMSDPPIRLEPFSEDSCKGRLYTSSYIGSCIIDGVKINIEPRFGNQALVRMLSCAANIHIAERDANIVFNGNDMLWILALIWKALLHKALENANVPRTYIKEKKNIRNFRGRLDINSHIRANIADASHFFCAYREFSINHIINRTILAVLRLFDQHYGQLMHEFNAFAERLATFGVSREDVLPEELDKITYTRMNEAYRPLMELSKVILEGYGAGTGGQKNMDNSAFFVDMSEIWELYLEHVLRKGLSPKGYEVSSANVLGQEDFLLQCRKRMIKPDIIIRKDNIPMMIIDAKYKRYDEFGAYAGYNGSVSREDLYQLITYMHHYGQNNFASGENNKITGLFTAPAKMKSGDAEVYRLKSNPQEQIGLVNLQVETCMAEYDEKMPVSLNSQLKKILQAKEERYVNLVESYLPTRNE